MARILPALALGLSVAGSAWGQTAEEIFDRANDAYREGRFAEAAEGYRSLLQYRIRDPIVEYNLANAEFRQGHLGQAILHYERAYRLDPIDPDILANLEYARSQCFDRVAPEPQSTAVRWLVATQNRLGPDRQAWFLLGAFWAIAALLAWALARPGGFGPRQGWIVAGLTIVLAVGALSWYTTVRRLEAGGVAIVLQPAVEVLAGPGSNNPTLFTIHEGLAVEIRSETEEWLQVSLPDGLTGWIACSAVGRV